MTGASGGGTKDRKNLFVRSLVVISRLIDFGGAHRASQSFSTFGLNSAKGSTEYSSVEVSECIEEEDEEESGSIEASSQKLILSSVVAVATHDVQLEGCSPYSESSVVVIVILL